MGHDGDTDGNFSERAMEKRAPAKKTRTTKKRAPVKRTPGARRRAASRDDPTSARWLGDLDAMRLLAGLFLLFGIGGLVLGFLVLTSDDDGSSPTGATVARGSGDMVVDAPPPPPPAQADPARGTVDVTIEIRDGRVVMAYRSRTAGELRIASPPCTYETTSLRRGQAQVDPQTNEIRGSGTHTSTVEPVDGDANCPLPSNPDQTLPDDQVTGQVDRDTGQIDATASADTPMGPIAADFDATVSPDRLDQVIARATDGADGDGDTDIGTGIGALVAGGLSVIGGAAAWARRRPHPITIHQAHDLAARAHQAVDDLPTIETREQYRRWRTEVKAGLKEIRDGLSATHPDAAREAGTLYEDARDLGRSGRRSKVKDSLDSSDSGGPVQPPLMDLSVLERKLERARAAPNGDIEETIL